jgi:hypothetical protein
VLRKRLRSGDDHAILDENGEIKPVHVYNEDGEMDLKELIRWAEWFERAQRSIANTKIGDHSVSTVFLGLNHQYNPMAAPLWFETMVFGPPYEATMPVSGRKYMARKDLWRDQCSTKAQAIAMHQKGIEWLKSFLSEKASPTQ